MQRFDPMLPDEILSAGESKLLADTMKDTLPDYARNLALVKGMTPETVDSVLSELGHSGVSVMGKSSSPLNLSLDNMARTMRVPNAAGVREIHVLDDMVAAAKGDTSSSMADTIAHQFNNRFEDFGGALYGLKRELVHELNARAVLDRFGNEVFESFFTLRPGRTRPVFFNKYVDELEGFHTY
jgi:hypothetical protein